MLTDNLLCSVNPSLKGLGLFFPTARIQMRLDCEIVPEPGSQGRAINVVETSPSPQLLPQSPIKTAIATTQPEGQVELTERMPGTVPNERGGITTQRVLNRIADCYIDTMPRTQEGLSDFLKYMEKVKNVLVVEKQLGSLIITVECSSLQILDGLWEDYCTGHLNEMAQKLLVTEEILREFGLLEVNLTTTILEEDYLACRQYFLHFQGEF